LNRLNRYIMNLTGEIGGARYATQSALLPGPGAVAHRQPQSMEQGVAADYDRRLFVTPAPVYQRVFTKLQRWKGADRDNSIRSSDRALGNHGAHLSPVNQVLRLAGEHGVGKTWLLRHLAEDEDQVAPAAVYLDLLKRYEFPTPEGFCDAVQRQIGLQCGPQSAILLLDSVPLHLDDHLRALENLVLRPHLSQRGSMAIMALNHPSRDGWRAPMLRGGESLWLHSFGQPQTRSQLQSLEKAGQVKVRLKAAAVQDRSGGLPLLNYLFTQWEQGQAFELFLEHIFSQIPARDRATVRSYLDAVCVLESLEHASIEGALRVYHHCQPRAGEYLPHAGQVRNALREHWLARSSPELPGRIVLVESVRRAAREALQARAPSLYVAMNESAHGTRGGKL